MATDSRSAFQAKGAKADVLRCQTIIQRRPIVARLSKPRERRLTSSGAKQLSNGRFAPSASRAIGSWSTVSTGSVQRSLRSLGLESRATMGTFIGRQPQPFFQNVASLPRLGKPSDYRNLHQQPPPVQTSLRSLGLESRATMGSCFTACQGTLREIIV